jgi:hypothetical protein
MMNAENKRLPKILSLGAIGAALVGGLVLGLGLSAGAGALPFGPPTAAPEYATNEAGETYGTASQARTPDEEPDLILAEATNGQTGYVRKSDLYGDLEALRTPADNVAYTEAQQAAGVREVNVYESDGVTVIGTFEVGGGAVSPE